MKRVFVIGLIALVSCVSVTARSDPEPPSDEPSATTALQTEYEFEPFPGSRWYGADGDEISTDTSIINAITGPEHCDWQSA